MNQKYREYKQLDLAQIADEILASWNQESTFQKVSQTGKEKLLLFFMKGRQAPMACPVFIM